MKRAIQLVQDAIIGIDRDRVPIAGGIAAAFNWRTQGYSVWTRIAFIP